MAKTYEELLEQAAIIRDETAAGKNTATRVGGTITDAVDYVKKLQDTYAGIHAEASEAKATAAAAKATAETAQTTATSANKKNDVQDNRIKKNEDRILNYIFPKLYQLNEGAGALPFDGEYSGSASVLDGRKTVAEDGHTYKVVFKLGKFLLQDISPGGVTVGLYQEWDKIIRDRGSSEDYAKRDRLYYIYVEGEGTTYYYIDSNGVLSEQSATYLLRRLVDKNVSEIATLKGKNAEQDVDIEDLGAKIRELGATIHDNGNLYEGTAGASSVPLVLAKTFGGTVTATLGAATSARAGVMTIDHVNRISKLEDRVLNYLYQKIYQLNEGAGARVFNGFTEETCDGELTITKDTYRYSVLYSTTQKQFVLNVTDEASGVTVLYSSWKKISLPNNKSIASSESYVPRDCLYYIYVEGEGSTYYYIDSNGEASEQSATYLLRKLVDKNAADIATASTAAQEAKGFAEATKSELVRKINGKQDALTLTVKDNGNIVLANIQGQSKEFMPATPSGDPMHYAFVTAGAEYNDTGADIVKDAPWADLADDDADKTVVHKAGYWYLNGLGDITNEQMQRIYMLTGSNQNYWNNYCRGQDLRTNIMTINENSDVPTNILTAASGLRRCTIEVLRVPTYGNSNVNSIPFFQLIYVENLKFIIGTLKASREISPRFTGKLKCIKIFGLYTSATFSDAKKLSMKSVLYMINNEAATSPITITLHADVYNRCMANEDILAALAAHTNISIASA